MGLVVSVHIRNLLTRYELCAPVRVSRFVHGRALRPEIAASTRRYNIDTDEWLTASVCINWMAHEDICVRVRKTGGRRAIWKVEVLRLFDEGGRLKRRKT